MIERPIHAKSFADPHCLGCGIVARSPALQRLSISSLEWKCGTKVMDGFQTFRACGRLEDPLPELLPDVLRRRLIIRIRNHLIQTRHEVHIPDFNELALHHESRDDEQDRGEHQGNVSRDEVRRVPVTPKEDGKAAEKEDQGDRDDAVPCRVGLKGGFEWEKVSIQTLSVPAGSESDVSNTDPKPCHKTGDRCHVLEPTEDFSWTGTDTHIGDKGEERTEGHSGPWKTVL